MSVAAEHADRAPTVISGHVAENIDRVLSAIRRYLSMDIAFVSEFLGTNRVFRSASPQDPSSIVAAGTRLPMGVGYCQHIVAGRLPELIADTSTVPLARELPETLAIPIGAHLSVPIRLDDGSVFGTFCCFSHEPKPDLGQRDLELMRTFGAMLASELRADLRAERDRADRRRTLDLALSGGDPRMVFQPVVRLDTLSWTAVEALARFDARPVRTPDRWFADAHEIGRGVELELLAVRRAIQAAASLPAALAVNVNVSPRTLVEGDLRAALGPLARPVTIEITEHVPVDNYDAIVSALAPLRALGVKVAIDDAGAGYSSLRHVLSMRPDILKFDVSLTRDIHRDPMRQAMVAALAEFAERTGTEVVAEGVETETELAMLRTLKVHQAQGYLFGRPDSAEALRAALR